MSAIGFMGTADALWWDFGVCVGEFPVAVAGGEEIGVLIGFASAGEG